MNLTYTDLPKGVARADRDCPPPVTPDPVSQGAPKGVALRGIGDSPKPPAAPAPVSQGAPSYLSRFKGTDGPVNGGDPFSGPALDEVREQLDAASGLVTTPVARSRP